MGQANGKQHLRDRVRGAWLARSISGGGGGGGRRRRRAHRVISHSYTYPDSGCADGVDVNLATEEHLMTVTGVTRELAKNIVNHRNTIGRYRRIDDLALVSGMGAEKLDEIRGEICVGRRRADDDSARSSDGFRGSELTKFPLDVNAATVFQLQCVPGFDQEVAANIVDHRKKRGRFRRLDDLIKVKGVDAMRLGAAKRSLAVEECDPKANGGASVESTPKNGSNGRIVANGPRLPSTPGHRKSSSMPPDCIRGPNGFNASPVDDIFDLLSAYSRRPVLEENFQYERDGSPALRIATWNLDRLTVEKSMNPGFREVVCRTVLENKISILCIQEVLTENALQIICKEMNAPCLKRVREWKENHRRWRYLFKPARYETENSFGYIYEDDYRNDIRVLGEPRMKYSIDDVNEAALDDSSDISVTFDSSRGPNFNRDIAEIKINDKIFIFLNLHLSESNSEYRTTLICELIDELSNAYDNLIVLGTFYTTKNLEELSSCYKSVIDPQINTSVELSTCNKKCGMLIPNNDCGYTDHSGVIKAGLTHLAIPQGWSWGGPASSHCPIWAEFFS